MTVRIRGVFKNTFSLRQPVKCFTWAVEVGHELGAVDVSVELSRVEVDCARAVVHGLLNLAELQTDLSQVNESLKPHMLENGGWQAVLLLGDKQQNVVGLLLEVEYFPVKHCNFVFYFQVVRRQIFRQS